MSVTPAPWRRGAAHSQTTTIQTASGLRLVRAYGMGRVYVDSQARETVFKNLAFMKKLLARARKLYEADRFPEALSVARRVLAVDKQNHDALFYAAYCLLQAGQFRRSLQYWKRLHKTAPDDRNVNLNMGCCYDEIGKPALALKHFKRELALNPVCCPALYNLGNRYHRTHKYKLAMSYFQRCHALKYSVDAIICKLAWCYFKTNRLDDEQALYEEYLDSNPNDTWALNNLGSHLMSQGAYHRALLRLRKAAQIDPVDKMVARNIRKTERLIKQSKRIR